MDTAMTFFFVPVLTRCIAEVGSGINLQTSAKLLLVTGVVLKEEVESAVGHGLDKFGENVEEGSSTLPTFRTFFLQLIGGLYSRSS